MTNTKTLPSGQLLDTQIAAPTQTKVGYELSEILTALNLIPTMASFQTIADDLNRIANPAEPWTKKYIHSVYHQYKGFVEVSPQFAHAVERLRQMAQHVPAGQAGTVYFHVLAQPDQLQDGVVIKPSVKSHKCARPGCAVVFAGPGLYCTVECRELWAKEKRRNIEHL